jgi:D-inositol-3-phosphate glycosyltransferase
VPALAILSMHTSPLAQPGTADAGGMNVYVRELATALARSGVRCEVYTRQDLPDQPGSAWVEPGFRAHFVQAGPSAPVEKALLPDLVEKWTAGVAHSLSELSERGDGVDLLHGNYWLSAAAGHALKHALDIPLVSTFHTLERVKAEVGEAEPDLSARRAAGEAAAIGCSDAILAASGTEAQQLVRLYGADPARIELVPPGVDRAFFSPGDQAYARRALGLPPGVPVVLFVGRIQPLKGLTSAVSSLARLVGRRGRSGDAHLVVIGGPSGPRGTEELARASELADRHGLANRVIMVAPQPRKVLSSYYRAADACVVPSRSESFGLVALEAAACGLPVVASAVGGLAELVVHGRTGYLLGADDVDGFAHYLGELLDDRALASLLGAAASERAGAYTWAAAAARVAALSRVLTGRELVSCG